MPPHQMLIISLGLTVVVAPLALVLVIGVPTLLGRPMSEKTTGRLVQVAVMSGLLASLAILGLMLTSGSRHVSVDLGNWVKISREQLREDSGVERAGSTDEQDPVG